MDTNSYKLKWQQNIMEILFPHCWSSSIIFPPNGDLNFFCFTQFPGGRSFECQQKENNLKTAVSFLNFSTTFLPFLDIFINAFFVDISM